MPNDVVVKVFDDSAECPKCGLGDTYTATEPDEPKIKMTYCKAGMPEQVCQGLPFEHLHVSCGRCAYVFLMNTKEYSEAKEKDKEKGRRGAHSESPQFQTAPGRGRRGSTRLTED